MEFKLLQPKMTTQDQIIIICVLAFIAAPLGTFISIKTINKLTRPPVNTLTTRTGDIELGHYIEPMRPPHSYQPIDSLNYEPYNWDERVPSFFTGEYPPSYYSGGNPPSFNSINRVYCPLEDYINLDYILWIILFSVFFLLIWILRNKILNYFRKSDSLVFTEGISINEITFTKDYQKLLVDRLGDGPNYSINYYYTKYKFLESNWTVFEINDWFKKLEDQDYAVIIELISKDNDFPRIILNNEFIVNSSSNPLLISTFLSEQIENTKNCSISSIFKDDYIIVINYTVLTASP